MIAANSRLGRSVFQVGGELAFVGGCRFVMLLIATLDRPAQVSGKITGNQFHHRRAGWSDLHLDAVVNQIIQCALADASNDDRLSALFAQPAGKRTGFVWRRPDDL